MITLLELAQKILLLPPEQQAKPMLVGIADFMCEVTALAVQDAYSGSVVRVMITDTLPNNIQQLCEEGNKITTEVEPVFCSTTDEVVAVFYDMNHKVPTSVVGDDGLCRSCKAKQPCGRGVMGSWHNEGCEWKI